MLGPSNMLGKVAIVTGASGDLGKAVALALAGAGADVCLVDFDHNALSAAADEIRAQGRQALACASDLQGAANCRAVVDATAAAFGRIDALCNVANVFAPAHAGEMADTDWEATLAINLSAPFYLFQASLPHLLHAKGAVVSVGSSGAHMALPYTAAYTASKAALVQLTRALAKEFIDQSVSINCLAPGSMSVSSGNQARIPDNVDMSKVQKLSRELITVEKVAQVVAFLASDAGSGFHGACLTMDNGLSLG